MKKATFEGIKLGVGAWLLGPICSGKSRWTSGWPFKPRQLAWSRLACHSTRLMRTTSPRMLYRVLNISEYCNHSALNLGHIPAGPWDPDPLGIVCFFSLGLFLFGLAVSLPCSGSALSLSSSGGGWGSLIRGLTRLLLSLACIFAPPA